MKDFSIQPFTAFLLGIAAIFTLSACGESEPVDATDELKQLTTPAPNAAENDAVRDFFETEVRNEATGLGQGKVTIHGAWNYTGYSTLTPLPEARLVAVDVTIVNHTTNFDYKDIEITDAVLLNTSYGSDPNIAILDTSGKLQPNPAKFVGAPGPTRLLLVYGVPKASNSFNLVYWRKKLNFEPFQPADSGWEVPYPSASPAPAPAPATKVE